jgi:hypothetical protein
MFHESGHLVGKAWGCGHYRNSFIRHCPQQQQPRSALNHSGNLLLISAATVSAESPDHGQCLIIRVISHWPWLASCSVLNYWHWTNLVIQHWSQLPWWWVPKHQKDHDQCRIISGKCPCLRSLPCVMTCHTKIWWSRSSHHAQNQWRLYIHHKWKLFCFVVFPLIGYS